MNRKKDAEKGASQSGRNCSSISGGINVRGLVPATK